MTVIRRVKVSRAQVAQELGLLTRKEQTALEMKRGASIAMRNGLMTDIERKYPQRYDRLLTVETWEKERRIRIIYGDYGDADYVLPPNTVTVKLDLIAFHESIGQFPSEQMIARLALLIHSNVHDDPLPIVRALGKTINHVWIEEISPVDAAVYEAIGQGIFHGR